ncbi:hypothetical protein AVEN_960-1 [Araneus ventricosus]|uniref:Uncharacterized protein n=1 Tax=Araneus ventricosus TaxID=182803 RepID=A0A4Y2CY36_ARAVE|nr:hypothetical protein AVEN_960-1 [Araneus ventricosus]
MPHQRDSFARQTWSASCPKTCRIFGEIIFHIYDNSIPLFALSGTLHHIAPPASTCLEPFGSFLVWMDGEELNKKRISIFISDPKNQPQSIRRDLRSFLGALLGAIRATRRLRSTLCLNARGRNLCSRSLNSSVARKAFFRHRRPPSHPSYVEINFSTPESCPRHPHNSPALRLSELIRRRTCQVLKQPLAKKCQIKKLAEGPADGSGSGSRADAVDVSPLLLSWIRSGRFLESFMDWCEKLGLEMV